MFDLSLKSSKLKKQGERLLERTHLLDNLKKFGEVKIIGSFPANLLIHGDIDITVIREKPFLQDEILDIHKFLYKTGGFQSYFIGGDWNDPSSGSVFPGGYYIGLKTDIEDTEWKIDIWFLDLAEFDRRQKIFQINNVPISDTQREELLRLKKENNNSKSTKTSQQIYEEYFSR